MARPCVGKVVLLWSWSQWLRLLSSGSPRQSVIDTQTFLRNKVKMATTVRRRLRLQIRVFAETGRPTHLPRSAPPPHLHLPHFLWFNMWPQSEVVATQSLSCTWPDVMCYVTLACLPVSLTSMFPGHGIPERMDEQSERQVVSSHSVDATVGESV
jgi:hypothetical protein